MFETLSQRDPKWKDQKLGFGSTTIEFFGCTISSIAMLADLTPDQVNDRLKKVNGFAGDNKNLVVWSKIKEAIPWLEFQWRGYEYNNDKVIEAIKHSKGCLVEVDGSRIGASRHWVLYVGDQEMHDPWFGTKKATSYYKPVGYATIKRIGNPIIEPLIMTTNLPLLNKYKVKTIEELDQKINEHAGTDWGGGRDSGYLGGEREKNKNLTTKISGLEEEINRLKADNVNYKTEADSRKKELQKLLEELAQKLYLPASSDKSNIVAGVERLLAVEDQLNVAKKELAKEEQKHQAEKSDMQKEIDLLKTEIAKEKELREIEMQKRDDTEKKLLQRIESLESRLNDNETASDVVNKWKAFLDAISKVFRKK